MRTLETLWNSYRVRVVPANAPEIQVQECRRAFYAGATALLGEMLSIPDGLTEEQEMEELMKIRQELSSFADLVTQGKA